MTGERRCTPGQIVKPTDDDCNRHNDHHWCGYCAGWYGVSHDFPALPAGGCHTRELCTMRSDEWHRVRAHATCVCRFCRLVAAHGSSTAACDLLLPLRSEMPVPEPKPDEGVTPVV